MDLSKQQLSLIHGCDVISRRQRFMQVVTGYLYKFDKNPPHRPRPLPLLVVLMNCLSPLMIIVHDFIVRMLVARIRNQTPEMQAIKSSVFIDSVGRVFEVYRISSMIANVVILLAQHGPLANTLASGNKHVTESEQENFGKHAFTFYLLKSFASSVAYVAVLSVHYLNANAPIEWNCLAVLTVYALFILKMIHNSPLVYLCYLGSTLGKHVENFSAIYVDSMFDQFMKAIEMEDETDLVDRVNSLPFFDTSSLDSDKKSDDSEACCSVCYKSLCVLRHHIVRGLVALYNFVRITSARLRMQKYPELPEMKMTKLSSTDKITISETVRITNSHMIRIRLKRTQMMLCELRDLVNDINKTSSPIILMYMGYESILMILVTTASIQAKVYKSVDVLLLPTISISIAFVANVVYLGTCMDEVPKQLKLLINKLFDFIIMNHRVRSTGKRAHRAKAQIHATDSEVCQLGGSEDGALNETWAQFQYTAKLASTIHFTMGGILPVTRKLVLSILGHVLSAVFISIEIMSIIDTLNQPHDAHHAKPASNVTGTQYDLADLKHHHIGYHH